METRTTVEAREGLSLISALLSEFDSFVEGFDHSDHGDEYLGAEDGDESFEGKFDCRFEAPGVEPAFETLRRVINAAELTADVLSGRGFNDPLVALLRDALAGR